MNHGSDQEYPKMLNGEFRKSDLILHILDLHACDLPKYYSSKDNIPRIKNSPNYSPLPGIYHLINKEIKPIIKIAGDFTQWQLVDVPDIIKADLYDRYDRYFNTQTYLWPSHRYEIVLPPGKYQYKWFVTDPSSGNSEWLFSKRAPLVFDQHGNINNVIDTRNKTFPIDYIQQDIKYKEFYLVSHYSTDIFE